MIEGLEAQLGPYFEGVPKYLCIDNFPAAVAKCRSAPPPSLTIAAFLDLYLRSAPWSFVISRPGAGAPIPGT